MTNVLRVVILVAILAVALWLAYMPSDVQRTLPATASQPAATVESNDLRFNGLAIQIDRSHRAVEYYSPLIQEIADLGADTIMIANAAYQETCA